MWQLIFWVQEEEAHATGYLDNFCYCATSFPVGFRVVMCPAFSFFNAVPSITCSSRRARDSVLADEI